MSAPVKPLQHLLDGIESGEIIIDYVVLHPQNENFSTGVESISMRITYPRQIRHRKMTKDKKLTERYA